MNDPKVTEEMDNYLRKEGLLIEEDEGTKLLECIKIVNRHINEGSVDTVEGIGLLSKLLHRYNRFLKYWNEGRIEALNSKYYES